MEDNQRPNPSRQHCAGVVEGCQGAEGVQFKFKARQSARKDSNNSNGMHLCGTVSRMQFYKYKKSSLVKANELF